MVKKNNSNQLCLLSKLHSFSEKWDKVSEYTNKIKTSPKKQNNQDYRPSYSLPYMLAEQNAFSHQHIALICV